MSWRGSLVRGAIVLLASFALAAQCDEEEVVNQVIDDTSDPLPQQSIVVVEIDVPGTGWVAIPVPQEGIERLARAWCGAERSTKTETDLCGPDIAVFDPLEEFDPPSLDGAALAVCQSNTCRVRNEVCAGYFLEEAARSPLPRELDPTTNGLGFFDLENLLLVPRTELKTAFAQAGAAEVTTTRKIRFQPMEAPGRAAALRGSVNRFRAAGLIARALQDPEATGRVDSCVKQLAGGYVQPVPTNLVADPDGALPSWLDIYYSTFLDAATQYSSVLSETVNAMRDSAEAQMRGRYTAQQDIATRWNGDVDSSVAIARLIGYGDAPPPTVPDTQVTVDGACGTDHKVTEIGPTGVPVCPPISEDKGTQKALKMMRSGHFRPTSSDFVLDFLGFKVAKLESEGGQAPATKEGQLAWLGLTEDSIQRAGIYQCAQARATGTFMLQDQSVSAYPQFFGTGQPSTPLPPAAVASHFTGAVGDVSTAKIDTKAYAASGAVRGIDVLKKTAHALKTDSQAVAFLPDTLKKAIEEIAGELAEEAGGRRIEYLVGSSVNTADGTAADRVVVVVHGVPENQGAAGEQYYLVHGLKGLKCAVFGTLDGAPCQASDYLINMNQVGTYTYPYPAWDTRMTDLTGGTLVADITSVPKPGNSTSPILIDDALYVLRVEDGVRKAFGGVVPKPGAYVVGADPWPNYSWATRQVIAPAGGSWDEVTANALQSNSDDCSKGETTCVGLPADIWPPLESEIVGNQSSQPYEQSWKHYLTLARAAADEADQLGLELIDQGLKMDEQSASAQALIEEECGVSEKSCGGLIGQGGEVEPDVWVTLGDKESCLWKLDGVMCKQPNPAQPVPCPLALDSNQTLDQCQSLVEALLPSQAPSAVPVHALKLSQVDGAPADAGVCYRIAALRGDVSDAELVPVGDETFEAHRSAYIRNHIMPELSKPLTQENAKNIRYIEHFADNYELQYGNVTVFDTRRGPPDRANSKAQSPCEISDADLYTGSTQWSKQLDCFEAGKNCGAIPGGVGYDGCAILTTDQISLDTEAAALQRRWAWGFGGLRRAVATLGVMTGQLGKMMDLRRPWSPVVYGSDSFYGDKSSGVPCVASQQPWEPAWFRRCTKAESFCVSLTGDPALGQPRTGIGRPVNFNDFLTNVVYMSSAPAGSQTTAFPVLCPPGAACAAGGVDPQMPYCGMPTDPEALATWQANNPQNPFATFENYPVAGATSDDKTSPYIGPSRHGIAGFSALNKSQKWSDAVDKMWSVPADDNFCAKKNSPFGGIESAIWRAMCTPLESQDFDSLTGNVGFMTRGELASGAWYASRQQVGDWLPYGGDIYNSALRDMKNGTSDFQYPMTQRNILDALDLMCHVTVRADAPAATNCTDIDANDLPTDNLNALAAALDCLGARANKAAERYTVGPISPAVLKAFATNQPLATTTGLGGEYLKKLKDQYTALIAINQGLRAIGGAQRQLAIHVREMDNLAQKAAVLKDITNLKKLATALASVSRIAQMAGGLTYSAFTGSGAAYPIAMQAEIGAAAANIQALDKEQKLADINLDNERLQIVAAMVKEAENSEGAVDGIVLAMNDLTSASADIELIKSKVKKALAAKSFADFAGEPGKDPQFVNVVMRRVYNTRLIRYEAALKRARQLAFLARRAIELRFGVDMTRMSEPMTLVEAPNKWVNDVCTMGGIDYSVIREPNAENPVTGYQFGQTPIPGDDFASEFIGDYVDRLEDFVNSYPIDYPLKDGDDVAVVSLSDDLFGVTASCAEEGRNLLYYSTEFNGTDAVQVVDKSTKGWFVDGCELSLPGDDAGPGEPWNGCIDATQVSLALSTTQDGGVPDASSGGGLLSAGLPDSAVAFRVKNQMCEPGATPEGEPIVCPSVSQYETRGALVQWVTGLKTGYYVASVYALADPDAHYESGNTAVLRVIREGATEPVIELPLTPSQLSWERFQMPFTAIEGEDYRVEILPSKDVGVIQVSGGVPETPSIYVAAAQVEAVGQQSGGEPETASVWVRTDVSRDTITFDCDRLRGPAFRKRFTRKCAQVCSDGIKQGCAAIDNDSIPTECYYEATFNISVDSIERGDLIPSGQLAVGNFNFRHNLAGINAVGTGVTSCDGKATSCYYNGFIEYSLFHSGRTAIRNYSGAAMPANMDRAVVEHGKMLAAERTMTNPLSSTDSGLIDSYMKGEFKGRPLQGLYTLRIWDRPGLRWENLDDIQLVWKYHYWTRFQK